MRWVIDLDGVVWLGATPIEGSIDALIRLHRAGHQLIFCTNHAESPSVKQTRLSELGVPDPHVVTSAEAAARLCGAGTAALVLGEPGLTETLRSAGVEATDVAELGVDGPLPTVDAVVVGASSLWDRSRTGLVADAVRAGARFIATNDDPTYPYTGTLGPRLLPGAGALVAAVATTAGTEAVVAGKPHESAADLITERFGQVDIVVGDRDDTDGAFARRLGARFALVLSGGSSLADVPTEPAPDLVSPNLAAVVATVMSADPEFHGPQR